MEASTNIHDELTALSPTLAAVNKVNPFTVPAGYFDTLSDDILAAIFREGHQQAVPDGYFDSLAGNILNRVKAEETNDASKELRALSPLLYSIQSADNLFSVPQGYFKNLPDAVLQKINEETAAEEITHLSPLLAGIRQKNVFSVPEGYFDNFYGEIAGELKPQAKVVSFGKRRNIMKYAVAAAVTGIMAITVFKFTGTDNKKLVMPEYAAQGLKIKPASVDAELAGLSNDDIVSYLEDNGSGIDASTLAATTLDEKNLPTEADYLLDDKTLDNFLNNVSVEQLKN